MGERSEGYYWIILSDEWEVAFYVQGEGWYSIWGGGTYNDFEIKQINETLLKNNIE